jgi:hypothetical protein
MLEKKIWNIVSIFLLIILCGCSKRTVEVEGRLGVDMVISGKTMADHLCLFSNDISYYLAFDPDCKFIGTEKQKDKEEALFSKNDIYLYFGERYRVQGKIRAFKIKPPDSDIVRISSDELEKLRKNAKEIVANYIEYIKP